METVMIRRHEVLAAAVLVLPLVFLGTPGAHDGHEHKVMGTVTMAAPDHVMLKDTENKDVTVYVLATTKIMRDKKPAAVRDVENGTRVVVTAVTKTENGVERLNATLIELGPAPAR
jgi:hypothetical protein